MKAVIWGIYYIDLNQVVRLVVGVMHGIGGTENNAVLSRVFREVSEDVDCTSLHDDSKDSVSVL